MQFRPALILSLVTRTSAFLRSLRWTGGLLLVGILMVGCTSASQDEPAPTADTSRAPDSPSATAETTSAPDDRAGADDRSLADRLDDARVETRVQRALVQERSLRVFEFRVEAVRGRVTLRGDVNTRDQYDEAARTARRVEGVSEVQNEVTVGSEPVSEDEPQASSGGEESESGAVYHTVDPGDSLWRIAQQYGTSISRLRALNDLPAGSLQPGQRIRVR